MDVKQETSSFNHILTFDISQDRTFESFKDGFKKKKIMGQSDKQCSFLKERFYFSKIHSSTKQLEPAYNIIFNALLSSQEENL